MAAKKEPAPKMPKSISPDAGLALFMKMAVKDASMKGKIGLASDIVDKYVDFIDIRSPRPCILLEYLFCSRGPAVGRVIKIDAEEATGKTSFLCLLYGMGQKSTGAYIINHEAERALMPVDRIARLGCDPSKMVLYRPGDLDDCLNTTETFVVNVRTQSDVAMKYPIYVGFDSVSAIAGTELDPDTGEPLDPKGKGLGYHARRFSEFFRDKLGFLASKNVILLGTGQHKTGFTTIGNKQMASGKTSLAEGTFKFYSSWIITMKKEACDRVGADTIVCRSSKNKLGPKRREIKMLLYNDHRGWDFDYGTASLLFSSFGPFSAKTEKAEEATCWKQHFGKDEFAALPGGLYTHSRVAGGLKYHAPEFVQAFYENTELVMQVREYWKVRGFGFAFEDVKVPWDENNAPVEPGAAEVDEDDEDEAALAAAEAHIGEIAGEAETPLPVVESAAGVPKLPGADYPKEVRRAK